MSAKYCGMSPDAPPKALARFLTEREVRQRAKCNNCGVKGNNTYQIVYTGNSDIAMDGAGVRSADLNRTN